jgi:hypothetical protein
MAVNTTLFGGPATRGDVGGIAINISLALLCVADALDALQENRPSETATNIKRIRELSDELSDTFDALVGWTKDDE